MAKPRRALPEGEQTSSSLRRPLDHRSLCFLHRTSLVLQPASVEAQPADVWEACAFPPCLSVCLHACLPVCQSVNQSVSQSVCLCLCVCVSASILSESAGSPAGAEPSLVAPGVQAAGHGGTYRKRGRRSPTPPASLDGLLLKLREAHDTARFTRTLLCVLLFLDRL